MRVVCLGMALIVAVSACNGSSTSPAANDFLVGQTNVSGSINTILKTATVSE